MYRFVALVFVGTLGVGVGVREAPAVAQVPTAPAPRVKAAPPVNELAALREAAEKSINQARRTTDLVMAAEEGLRLTREKLNLTEAAVAKGMAPAADLKQDRATEARFLEQVERFRRLAAADAEAARDAQEHLAFAARDGAEVAGTLAVDVRFPDADRYRVAAAARALVEAAAESTEAVPGDAGAAALRGAHVRIQYPRPRRFVKVDGGPNIALDLVIVALPLTRSPGGYVLVCYGDRVVRFSKFPAAAAARFQEALASAVPAGRAP